jgi:hypothetical protein
MDLQSQQVEYSALKRAILETLAYSDVFSYPLRLDELHHFLPVSASVGELTACLNELDQIGSDDGYYFLSGRAQIVMLRKQREESSRRAFERAMRYGRILGMLPFIRMVALTGSLAMRNCDETGDYDYMLVAKKGRVWLARAFALLLNRVVRLFNESICPNLIVSEEALRWHAQNLYSARELCQLLLIRGQRTVGFNFRVANLWVADYFPNFKCTTYQSLKDANKLIAVIRSLFEFLLNNRLGDRLEAWEMNRKIARFTQQEGLGAETNFNADICQGNFDHHGSRTMERYQQRLLELGIQSALSQRERQEMQAL